MTFVSEVSFRLVPSQTALTVGCSLLDFAFGMHLNVRVAASLVAGIWVNLTCSKNFHRVTPVIGQIWYDFLESVPLSPPTWLCTCWFDGWSTAVLVTVGMGRNLIRSLRRFCHKLMLSGSHHKQPLQCWWLIFQHLGAWAYTFQEN